MGEICSFVTTLNASARFQCFLEDGHSPLTCCELHQRKLEGFLEKVRHGEGKLQDGLICR